MECPYPDCTGTNQDDSTVCATCGRSLRAEDVAAVGSTAVTSPQPATPVLQAFAAPDQYTGSATSYPPPTPSPPAKRSSPNPLLIGGAGVLVLVVGIVAIMLGGFRHDDPVSQPGAATATTAPAATPAPPTATTAQPDPTANPLDSGRHALSGRYSNQLYRYAADIPHDYVQQNWDDHYNITNLTYGDGEWALVMSQGPNTTEDTVVLPGAELPEGDIAEHWKNDEYITNMTYSGDGWVVVMATGTGFVDQSYVTKLLYPADEIAQYPDFDITGLTFSNGYWGLVMSKDAGYGKQLLFNALDLPKDRIDHWWSEGYQITNIAYGNAFWIVVMSPSTSWKQQTVHISPTFPHDEIRKDWDQGYYITNLAYGKGGWVVVMSQDR